MPSWALLRLPPSAVGSYGPIDTGGLLEEYATGTNYASAGLALVGEYGPELVLMHGGEEVIDAARTRELLQQVSVPAASVDAIPDMSVGGAGESVQINVPVSINIDGDATPEMVDRLENIISDLQEGFADRVLEVVEDAATDKARRSYS